MPVNDKLRIHDYNAIQSRISNILGNGSASYGYGQLLNSSQIVVGTKNSKTIWDNLANDIENVNLHQTGTQHLVDLVGYGNKARYNASSPHTQYNNAITNLETTRFTIHSSRSKTVNKGSSTANFPGIYGTSWSDSVSCIVTYTFNDANSARHFFNSGGKLRFSSSRTGGNTSAQNNAWSNLLNSAGIIEFDCNTTPANFYGLTNIYNSLISYTVSGIYSYTGSEFKISAKCNVADNSSGTATTINFLVQWMDPAGDVYNSVYGDAVDGALTLSSATLEATGALIQGSQFTVESPAISYSSFTVS